MTNHATTLSLCNNAVYPLATDFCSEVTCGGVHDHAWDDMPCKNDYARYQIGDSWTTRSIYMWATDGFFVILLKRITKKRVHAPSSR